METLVCLVCIVYLFNFLATLALAIVKLIIANKEKKMWTALKQMTEKWAIPDSESDFED